MPNSRCPLVIVRNCRGEQGLFFPGTHFSKDRKISLIASSTYPMWGWGARKDNYSLLKERPLLVPLRNNKKQNKLIPQRVVISHPLKPERSREGRRRRIMEARITVLVFPLSIHLFTCVSLMKKARDKWREKLDRSFLCCFPLEEGSIFPIPSRSQPASQPPVIPGIPPAFHRDWEYPEGI